MFKYAFKRVVRGYKLTLALAIGVLIATTFFASMLMSADVLTQDALKTALEGVDYDARIQANNMTWTPSQYQDLEEILEGLSEVSLVDRYARVKYSYNASLGQGFDIVGLETDSEIWRTLSHINGTRDLGVNETYVVASSVNASLLSIGQVLQVPIMMLAESSPHYRVIYVNLTVAGFVDISENTARLLNPPRYIDFGFTRIEQGDWRRYDLLLVNFDKTILPILDWYAEQEDIVQLSVTEGFLCRLNRDMLVNPYDISGSASNVQNAIDKIEDRTAAYNTQVTDLLGPTLASLSFGSAILAIAFVGLAAPVIFMSWYSSTMLSDVSYNLRRREFGLLQTKGFGPKSIKRMLELEGVIIGLISGIAGLFAGTAFAHVIANAPLETLLYSISGNLLNSVVILVFSMILALWSVRGPADRASKLEPLDSLKQYVYIEETREYRRLLPTIALILGTYKIIVWALGINMTTLLATSMRTNFLLFIAVALWSPVDAFLNFAGPIMFLYGLTKILLRGSQKFQEAIVNSASRFFGAFGKLATRNVRRNPMRNAALVFVVSLIVSYGVFSVGSLFSQQDNLERSMRFTVGSDVSATFPAGTNVTGLITNVSKIEGVVSATTEHWITLSTTAGSLNVRGINGSAWQDTAFYEDFWFSGCDLKQVFTNFTGYKILLSISVARQLDLRVGNMVTVRSPTSSSVYQLEIVGLVGYVSPLEEFVGQFAFSGNYPSYVPIDFLQNASLLSYTEPHVLVKTTPGTNGTVVEEQIKALYPSVESTDSFTSEIKAASENKFEVAGTRSRWLGIAFAVTLAVVGTGLVVGLTLKEKEYEVTLLGVRGFERGQILKVLFGEVMIMVLFSLILGFGTGLVQLFGDISNTSQNTTSLVRPRIVFSPLSILSVVGVVGAVIIAALVPVLLASRLTEEKISVLRE